MTVFFIKVAIYCYLFVSLQHEYRKKGIDIQELLVLLIMYRFYKKPYF